MKVLDARHLQDCSKVLCAYVHSIHSIHSVVLQPQVSSAEGRSSNKQVHKVSASVLQHSLRG